jgi:hypothetical protein
MRYEEKELSVLSVSSLKDLVTHEKEIVRRIGAISNGGRLLLLHSQRLLREIGVELKPEAVKEIQKAHHGFFTTTGGESAYDRVAKSKSGGAVRVTVHGLFPKEAA